MTKRVTTIGIKSPLTRQLQLAASCLTDINKAQDLSLAYEWLEDTRKTQPDEKVDGLMGYYFEVCEDIDQAFSCYQENGEGNSYLADLRLASIYESVGHFENAFYYYQLAMEKFGDSFSLLMMIYYLEKKLVDYDDFDIKLLKSLLDIAINVEQNNIQHNNVYYDLIRYLARCDDTFSQRFLCCHYLYVVDDEEKSQYWLNRLQKSDDTFS